MNENQYDQNQYNQTQYDQTQFRATDLVSREDRLWAMGCHFSALLFFVIPLLGHIIGPLVIWLIKKENSPFVDYHGKEALNFQISTTIYGFVCTLLTIVVIGVPLLIALFIFWFIVMIIAAVKANDGHHYRYPLSIRFF